MVQTEDPNCPNISWAGDSGKPLVVAFTGMARGLNELANFEFMKTLKGVDCSQVFIRDPFFSFYHRGIDEEVHNIPLLAKKIEEIFEVLQPSYKVFIGVSAGGYAAMVFGHLLKADVAHSFGPQTILYKSWGEEHDDYTIRTCENLHTLELEPQNDFRDLQKVLAAHNGKTKYHIHVSTLCDQDMNHANHVKDCPAVEIVPYKCDGHACASRELRGNNKLGQVIMKEYLERQ